MENLKELLSTIEKEYASLLETLDRQEKIDIEGSLQVTKRRERNSFQYFHYVKDSETGIIDRRAISKNDMELARSLAQKSYNERISKVILKVLKAIASFKNSLPKSDVDNEYLNLDKARKALVVPIRLTMNQREKHWIQQPYQKLQMNDSFKKFLTNRGEKVRSKSEKIIADRFESLGINYKYECLLILRNNKHIYPDFTLLNKSKDREIYWEHFGLMDSPEYAQKAIEKINLYEQNGYFLGESLIVTFETSQRPIDFQTVDKKIERYF